MGLFLLRGAIHSTALSHEPSCTCVVCRAAAGDQQALAYIIALVQAPASRSAGTQAPREG